MAGTVNANQVQSATGMLRGIRPPQERIRWPARALPFFRAALAPINEFGYFTNGLADNKRAKVGPAPVILAPRFLEGLSAVAVLDGDGGLGLDRFDQRGI